MIEEEFPNPTVKQVIFQIRFPNLFYLENKIGDLQFKIMKKFPESSLLHKQSVIFTEGIRKNNPIPDDEDLTTRKIWRFESKDRKIQVNVLNDSLDINSRYHKTYNDFKKTIEFVLGAFLDTTNIPIINRIGLRYVDECPIKSKDNESFLSYYNTAFPLESRFNLEEAAVMDFQTLVKRDEYNLFYCEFLQTDNEGHKLILDMDAFAENIDSENYIDVIDELHKILNEEFEKTIKKPLYEHMRNNPDGEI